ncbi:MspA family porin [Nocardia violaceofusca]|uniref:MspA family porin n=1 Tax=Nocardia violaceofusca TaxID=941182 RepID=UPI000A040EDE
MDGYMPSILARHPDNRPSGNTRIPDLGVVRSGTRPGPDRTFRSLDYAAHPVTALNGMPTNREVFLDNTSYARIPSGTGTLKAGCFVACAVDIDLGFSADASASAPGRPTLSSAGTSISWCRDAAVR